MNGFDVFATVVIFIAWCAAWFVVGFVRRLRHRRRATTITIAGFGHLHPGDRIELHGRRMTVLHVEGHTVTLRLHR